MEPGEEALTARQIGEKYKLTPETVLRKARTGEWPARHVGRNWRFFVSEIEQVLHSRNPMARSPLAQKHRANAARRAGRWPS